MSLQGVSNSGNRIIPEGTLYDAKQNRGIAVQKGISRRISSLFGSGTIKVTINNNKCYLNKGSCYKFVTPKNKQSRNERKAFLKKSDQEIITAVQAEFDKLKPKPDIDKLKPDIDKLKLPPKPIQIQEDLVSLGLDVEAAAPKMQAVAGAIEKLVIGTYNVLFPQPLGGEADIYNTAAGYSQQGSVVTPNTDWRLQIKTQNILKAQPTSLALQEITQEEFKHYQENLKDYVGIFSGPHSPGVNHGVAIFYQKDRFNLLAAKKGTFAGQRRGPKGELLAYGNGKPIMGKRSHLIVDLQDKTSGTIVRMVSCHLIDPRDWQGAEKSSHTGVIAQHAKEKNEAYKVDVVAVCGDMNQDQYGDDATAYKNPASIPAPLASITAFTPFTNKFIQDNSVQPTEYDKDPTKPEGYNSEMESTGRKIDWIFIKTPKSIQVKELKPVTLNPAKLTKKNPELKEDETDVRGSDHMMALSELNITRL